MIVFHYPGHAMAAMSLSSKYDTTGRGTSLLVTSASPFRLWHDPAVLGSQIVGSTGCALLRGLCRFVPVLPFTRAGEDR